MPSPTSRRDQLVVDLAELLEESSGLELSVEDAKTPFLEIGLDSLFLTQFAIALGKRFKIKVTFRQLLEHYPTMDSLAAHIETTLPPESRAEPPKGEAAPAPKSPTPVAVQAPLTAVASAVA